MTKNGKIILDVIEEVTCHPTAEDVYKLLLGTDHSMSMATVYNNLNALSNEGTIRKLSIPNQPERYDRVQPHDHLICLKCGIIKDLFLKDRMEELRNESGVMIESYDLQLYHICDACRQKEIDD